MTTSRDGTVACRIGASWDGERSSPRAEQSEDSADERVAPSSPRMSEPFSEPFSPLLSLPEALEIALGTDEYDELEFSGVDLLRGTMDDVTQAVQRMATPSRILLRDKVTFMAGVISSLLDAYYLGWSPSTFYRVYSIQVVLLLALRWVVYRVKRWHYYLLDFCYFANVLMLVQLWLLPHSALMNKVMFAYATGPLAWSIVAFRNSMVFHSLDKMTSLLLHWMPACVVWTLRWYPHRSARLNFGAKSEGCQADWHHGSLLQLVLIPFLPYLAWAIAYYVKIFVISSTKIQERGYEPIAYMAVHMACVVATLLLARCFWESFHAHTLFLLCILCVSVWNGAGFYFQIFARRYLASLEQQGRRRSPSAVTSQKNHE